MKTPVVAVGAYSLSHDHHIVYDDNGCRFTLAIFRSDSEGYSLEFIGDRPFRYSHEPECSFMEFADACQKYLNGVWYLDQFTKGKL